MERVRVLGDDAAQHGRVNLNEREGGTPAQDPKTALRK